MCLETSCKQNLITMLRSMQSAATYSASISDICATDMKLMLKMKS